MAITKKVTNGAKLATALSAERQRHIDALNGIVAAAKLRRKELDKALDELHAEQQLLGSIVS